MKKFSFCIIYFLLTVVSTFAQNYSKEDFKNDLSIKKISENLEYFKSSIENSESEKVKLSLDSLVYYSKSLLAKYGEENSNTFFEELIMEERLNASKNSTESLRMAGDKCHRNDNGTVNADDCNFWENISVAFSAALRCVRPGGYPVNKSEVNDYYNCVQASVCRIC